MFSYNRRRGFYPQSIPKPQNNTLFRAELSAEAEDIRIEEKK